MSDLFRGLVQGFLPQAQQIIQQNEQKTLQQAAREKEVLETLAQSQNPEIAARAMDGLMQIASGKRGSKGGLLGKLFSAPPEELPHFQQIMSIADQFKQSMETANEGPDILQAPPKDFSDQTAQDIQKAPGIGQPPSAAMPAGDMVTPQGQARVAAPPTLNPQKAAPEGMNPGLFGLANELEGAGMPMNPFGLLNSQQGAHLQNNRVMERQEAMDIRKGERDDARDDRRDERHRKDLELKTTKHQDISKAYARKAEIEAREIELKHAEHQQRISSGDARAAQAAVKDMQVTTARLMADIDNDYQTGMAMARQQAYKPGSGIDPQELQALERIHQEAREERKKNVMGSLRNFQAARPTVAAPTGGGGNAGGKATPAQLGNRGGVTIRLKPGQ